MNTLPRTAAATVGDSDLTMKVRSPDHRAVSVMAAIMSVRQAYRPASREEGPSCCSSTSVGLRPVALSLPSDRPGARAQHDALAGSACALASCDAPPRTGRDSPAYGVRLRLLCRQGLTSACEVAPGEGEFVPVADGGDLAVDEDDHPVGLGEGCSFGGG